jgi:hypothetical protein
VQFVFPVNEQRRWRRMNEAERYIKDVSSTLNFPYHIKSKSNNLTLFYIPTNSHSAFHTPTRGNERQRTQSCSCLLVRNTHPSRRKEKIPTRCGHCISQESRRRCNKTEVQSDSEDCLLVDGLNSSCSERVWRRELGRGRR